MRSNRAIVFSAVGLGALLVAAPAAAQSPLVIDHTCADIDQIPTQWLDAARDLAIHYGHTSHGSQIVSGLNYLAGQDPRYAVTVSYAGSSLGASDIERVLSREVSVPRSRKFRNSLRKMGI